MNHVNRHPLPVALLALLRGLRDERIRWVVLAAVIAPDQPVHRATDEGLIGRQHGSVEVDAGVVVDGDFHGLRYCHPRLAPCCVF